MQLKTFYGPEIPTTLSYLEFGSIDLANSQKAIWDFKLHDKAYDWLMLSRYANDMVAYLNLKKGLGKSDLPTMTALYLKEMHHKNDASLNLSKLLALLAVKKVLRPKDPLSFFELGQTIFGCIEGMEFYLKWMEHLGLSPLDLDLAKVEWFGMDISAFFNTLCVVMHQGYNVKATDDLESFHYPKDVFFAKGVTLLYACQSADELLKNLDRGKISVFDYSFAVREEQKTSIGTGKQVTYPTLKAFLESSRNTGKNFYVRTNKSAYSPKNDRLFVDGVYGEKSICQEFIKLDMEIRNALRAKITHPEALFFIDLSPDEITEWVSLEDFGKKEGIL